MAIFGIVLVIVYRLTVSDKRIAARYGDAQPATRQADGIRTSLRALLAGLFSTVSVVCAYVGSGLQLFIMGAVIAWMPSFLNRYYSLLTARASAMAAAFVLLSGVGMILCGSLTDRLCRAKPVRKFAMAVGFSLASCVLIAIALRLDLGTAQLVVLGAGIFLAGGTTGPATAMVANVTHASIHATAFATLSLANNLLGMAPGPIVTGALADRWGLLAALRWAPMV